MLRSPTCQPRGARIPVLGGARAWIGLALMLVGLLWSEEAMAQRPFRMNDPFYRNETARRDFFDGFALTTEVSFRTSGSVQDEGLLTTNPDLLGLSFRFDYQLAQQVDVGAIIEATGGSSGRALSLSWIVLKYYRYLENSDYAFRLAVDPASDGRVGFPQIDVAFLYTSLLSADLSTDFAIGMRRVRLGYWEYASPSDDLNCDDPPSDGVSSLPSNDILYTRALGNELHLMMNYRFLVDPARSNLFIAFQGEGGQYELIESFVNAEGTEGQTEAGEAVSVLNQTAEGAEESATTDYRGGVLWFRGGVELSRPSYQMAPFLSVPLKQWNPDGSEWPEARLHVGVRLVLR